MVRTLQTAIVYELLRRHSTVTDDLARKHGIRRLAARIHDLRKRGVEIETKSVPVPTRYGDVRVAAYALRGQMEMFA